MSVSFYAGLIINKHDFSDLTSEDDDVQISQFGNSAPLPFKGDVPLPPVAGPPLPPSTLPIPGGAYPPGPPSPPPLHGVLPLTTGTLPASMPSQYNWGGGSAPFTQKCWAHTIGSTQLCTMHFGSVFSATSLHFLGLLPLSTFWAAALKWLSCVSKQGLNVLELVAIHNITGACH
jgi:hypothetical protein